MDGHGYTQEDLAKVIGKSRSHLANTLRLLKLPRTCRSWCEPALLSAGHARALIGRADASALAARIVNEGLTVRQIEALVKDEGAAKPKQDKSAQGRRYRAAEAELQRGARAWCGDQAKGQGREGRIADPLRQPRPARGPAPPPAAQAWRARNARNSSARNSDLNGMPAAA